MDASSAAASLQREDGVEEFCAFHATRAFSMGSQARLQWATLSLISSTAHLHVCIHPYPDTQQVRLAVPFQRFSLTGGGEASASSRSLVREGISAAERSGGGEGGFAQHFFPHYFLICLWVSSSIRYDEMV